MDYYSSENADEVFAKKIEEQGIDPVLFGLTDKDFELLDLKTLHKLEQNFQETNTLLEEYKKYYEDYEETENQTKNLK